ncbi:MAG: hypothetical protein IJC78_06200 [Clostridia bacterium]|nr:hypothetical protein [Clostridia bacterium]
MKKILAWLLAACLLQLFPVVYADTQEQDYTLYTFENGSFSEAVTENGVAELSSGVYGNGLYIESDGGEASVSLPFPAEQNVTYRVSVWVDAKEPVSISVGGEPLSAEEMINGEGSWKQYAGVVTLSETAPETAYLTVTAQGSFTVDDCLIYSEKRQVKQTGNMVANGSCDEDLSGWKTSGATATQIEGANGTKNALCMQVLTDWGRSRTNVSIDFGRTYRISWYAKAVSEDAVGLDIKYILDRVPYRQDTATPMYFEKAIGKLTDEWQYFEVTHKELNLTTDQCEAELYFRAGTGRDKVTFAVDEVSVVEVENSYTVDSTVITEGDRITGESITATIYKQGLVSGVYYRVLQSFGEGYVVLASGYTEEAVLRKELPDNFTGTCRVEINPKDINGIVGKTVFSSWKKAEFAYEENLITNIQEEIWTPDSNSLTAEVVCRSTKEGETLSAYFAAYGENGALIRVEERPINHLAGTESAFSIETAGATRAKLMLFDGKTLQPVKQADEIEKTQKGIFIYADIKNGRDFAEGTYDAPLKTLSGAKVKVRSVLDETTEDIYVVLKEGEYPQMSQLTFTENDSSDAVKVTYVAEKKGKTRLSGGVDIDGFSLWDSGKNIYRVYVGTKIRTRQMFVDGIRAVRARSEGGIENPVNLGEEGVGFTTTDKSFLSYKHIEDLEFHFFEEWTHSVVGVKSARDNGDGTVTVSMRETDWDYQWNLKGNCYPSKPEFIENALELLDEEGEWYLDTHEGYLYYKPRVFEKMDKVRVTLPVCETMLALKGENAHNPIRNMAFRGIVFENTTWNAPSEPGGFCCGQNNKHFGGEERFMKGAIHVEHAHGIAFRNCRFARLGMTGMKIVGGIKDIDIVGNEFYDISGGALVIGDVFESFENPTPYLPEDEAYIVEDIQVTDNYMHKIAVDYRGGAALSTSFPVRSALLHNEIYDTSYSGMHLGWGWNTYDKTIVEDYTVKGNYIHRVLNTDLYDGGGVYFLGRTNGHPEHPNRFEENYLYDIGNAFGAIYPDNGSTNWDILSNVCDMSKTPVWHRNYDEGDEKYEYLAQWLIIHMSSITDIYLDNNYTTTANEMNNGTVNVVNKNVHVYPDAVWPEEARGIIDRSGAREPYRDNFRYGLQEVDIDTEVTVKAGKTLTLTPVIQTAKEALYAPGNFEVYTVSKDPGIAVYENGIIQGKTAGKTEILLYVKEGDVLKSKKITVTVQ